VAIYHGTTLLMEITVKGLAAWLPHHHILRHLGIDFLARNTTSREE